ncbi:hypothetical protein BLNAU_17165 [Blattamonas nauphoetae]|uniref:Ubiquitin-like domain-containing protein n=1 Tax=Blattamonas nauphoetae TaxID=2049346 RepID=A0ABQ9X7W3_9EUKA|nr:hypothetical protein BLNAU_17165 [Blattamonas nauphoetae]
MPHKPTMNNAPENQPTNPILLTVDTVLEKLNQWDGTTDIVKPSIWEQIPTVISEFSNESQSNIEHMTQLLDRLGLILNKILDENTPINNRRVLFQALHSLSHSPSCDRTVKRRVDTLLPLFDSISDTNLVLINKAYLDSLESQILALNEERTRLKEPHQRTEQVPEAKQEDIDGNFTLKVRSASDDSDYDFNVHPQNTIGQMKQILVPFLNVSMEHIALMHEAITLSDTTTLAEINFRGHFVLLAFTVEPENEKPVTETDNTDESIQLTVKSADTGDQFTLKVYPQHTIRQIKQALVPHQMVPSQRITLFHLADELNDDTVFSEINFEGSYALISFIEEEDASETKVDGPFKLKVKIAETGDKFTFNVNPQNTIVQIKELLSHHLKASVDAISLMHEADELKDSTVLSEITSERKLKLVAFVIDQKDSIRKK